MGARTTKCVICGSDNPPCGGGNVLKGEERVITTFCNEHFPTQPTHPELGKGCYGYWKEWMGYEPGFCEVTSIDSDHGNV